MVIVDDAAEFVDPAPCRRCEFLGSSESVGRNVEDVAGRLDVTASGAAGDTREHQWTPADTRWHASGDESHIAATVPKIRTRSSPVEDENVAVQLDEVDVVEGIGQGVGVPGEQVDKSSLRMLPVDTRSSRRGAPDSRCPSTKSRSFVTTIRSWTSAIRVISRSGVRLPFGSSDVCTTSWPNSINSGTRRTGSCASTSRRIYAADVGTESLSDLRRVLERRKYVVALEVGVVNQHFVRRHSAGQQAHDHRHGIAESANGRRPVTDLRVHGDPVQQRHNADASPSSTRRSARFRVS